MVSVMGTGAQNVNLAGTTTAGMSQEAATSVLKSFQSFLKELELGVQKCFAIDQVRVTGKWVGGKIDSRSFSILGCGNYTAQQVV